MENEKAVKIIEWLGWIFTPTDDYIDEEFWDSPDGMEERELQEQEVMEWLESALGQEKLMDKLEKTHQIFWDSQRGTFNAIPYDQKDEEDFIFVARQNTRQLALIKVVLEMIEKEEEEDENG